MSYSSAALHFDPLHVLAVVSRPLGPADLDRELHGLRLAFAKEPRAELTVLETPSPFELRRVLLEGAFQVLHYLGHGLFEAQSGQGALTLDGSDDPRLLIPGEEFARLLKDASALQLVVLNSCESGRSHAGGVDPLTGVAAALAKSGFPAIVAMQSPISDRAALAFSRTFYQRLAAGDPVEAAMSEGRLAVTRETPQEWATPVLFSPVSSDRLVDVESQKRDRHAELVDKKFRSSLTEPEQDELLQLQAYFDEIDSKFYEPIEKKLESALTKLRQRSQAR